MQSHYRQWADGELDALIDALPASERAEMEKFRNNLDFFKDLIMVLLELLYRNALENAPEPQAFARFVDTHTPVEYKAVLLYAFQHGDIPEHLVREHICTHYREFELKPNERMGD